MKKKICKKLFSTRQIQTIFEQKIFKPETTTFPQGLRISRNFGHPTFGSGGKKRLKRYLKSEETDRRTDGQTDRQTHRQTF